MTENDEVAKRIKYNRIENEKYFQISMLGKSMKWKLDFQMRLLDAMFSVIENEDFKKLCDKCKEKLGVTTIQ